MLGQGSNQRAPSEGRVALGQRIVSIGVSDPPAAVLMFAGGCFGQFDFQRLLDAGKIFLPLQDPAFFRTAHPGNDGASLEWVTAEGDEIDLCADWLRFEAEGIWNPANKEWNID